jgi:hypothetical protein
MSVSTQDPEEKFWTLYRRASHAIHRLLGGGLATPSGVFLRPEEVYTIWARYGDPEWEIELWPTAESFPIYHPSHLTSFNTTMGASFNVNMSFIAPCARYDPEGSLPERSVWHMWFTGTVYPFVQFMRPIRGYPYVVPLMVTTGDMVGTLCIGACEIDLGWNYGEFASSLVNHLRGISPLWKDIMFPIIHRGCIKFDDLAIFLIPPECPMDNDFHRLIALLTFYQGGYGYLASALERFPWDGPLGHLTWAQVTAGLCEDDFKLLVVTGYERMVLWMKSVSHSIYTRLLGWGLDYGTICQYGAQSVMRILSPGESALGPLRWHPESIFHRKVYTLSLMNPHQVQRLQWLHQCAAKIVTHRAKTVRLRAKFILIALIPLQGEQQGRLARYTSQKVPSGYPLADLLKMAIDNNDDILGDGSSYTAMLINNQEYHHLVQSANQGIPAGEPDFMRDAGRRFFEAHRLYMLNFDEQDFDRFTDFRSEIRCCRFLFKRTSTPLPQRATTDRRDRELEIYYADGWFISPPSIVFPVCNDWDYVTFLTELLCTLREEHFQFGQVYSSIRISRCVKRGDIRIFIVPRLLGEVLHFVCALLCDRSPLSDDYLGRILPEVTWDGCARCFPLHAVIPPNDICRLFIIPKQSLRRGWARFDASYKGSPVCIEECRYYANAVYRCVMPWYAQLRPEMNIHLVHIHTTRYQEDSEFERRPDHLAALMEHARATAAVVLSQATPPQQKVILEMTGYWGGHFKA